MTKSALFSVACTLFAVSVIEANRDVCPGCAAEQMWLSARDGTSIHAYLYLPPPGLARHHATNLRVPGVIIAPGFLANLAFMEIPWAEEITHLGAAALFIDRRGQGESGGNLWPTLQQTAQLNDRQPDIAAAIEYLRSREEIDAERLAILGHSDGATAAITAGAADWNVRATVAISASVAPSGFVNHVAPQDLLLIYGEDDRFVRGNTDTELIRRATRGYLDAPGVLGEVADGSARGLIRVSNYGHVDVLYSTEAHEAALNWIGESLGAPGPRVPLGSRIAWIWLGVTGLFCALAAAPIGQRHLPLARDNCAVQDHRPISLGALVVVCWIGGLSLAPFLCRWVGFLIPASEGRTFFFILVGPLVALRIGSQVYEMVARCQLRQEQNLLEARHLVSGAALAAMTYGTTWVLLRHHYEVWLGPQRMVLSALVSSAAVPLFAILDRIISLAGEPATVIVITALTPVSAQLLFERMSVLPGYLLAIVLLLFTMLRWAHPTRRRSVVIGCGLTTSWLAGVVCALY